MKYCQGPKCHEYKTKDRIRGSKGDKHYETRKRSHMYYNGNFCSLGCQDDWFRKFGNRNFHCHNTLMIACAFHNACRLCYLLFCPLLYTHDTWDLGNISLYCSLFHCFSMVIEFLTILNQLQ